MKLPESKASFICNISTSDCSLLKREHENQMCGADL
jgi:hypothetical protein